MASQRGERVTCHLEICLLNRLNLCELFFEESVREGGVIIFVKKWVLIGFLMDKIGVSDPPASSDLRKLVGSLARWLVDLLACWLDLGAKKKALILTNRGLLNFMNRICIEKCNSKNKNF